MTIGGESGRMPSTSRRTLIAGSLGGLVAAVGGAVAWNAYATRTHVRFRPLRAVNESDETVDLVVTAVDESDGTTGEVHEPTLAPAGETGHTATLRGRSVSYPARYGVIARAGREPEGGTEGGDRELDLPNAEIVDRHPDIGWGSDDVRVAVVVEADGTLSARVGEPRERY